jgi:hypothetical protein
VDALRAGGYRPLDFRQQRPQAPLTAEVSHNGPGI